MPLTATEITEILKGTKQGQRKEIPLMLRHEDRVRLHSETTTERPDNPALSRFLMNVEHLLPRDKFEMFCFMMNYPLPTTSLTGRIYQVLKKLFDGRNPVIKHEFTSERNAEDYKQYRRQKCSLKLWQTKGYETMKTAINSVVIIDLPMEQDSDRPEPYIVFLNLSQVIDFETDCGKFEWIRFNHSEGKEALFDDSFYRIVNKETKQIEYEVSHDLGYCPASFFWDTSISLNKPCVKASPISSQLGSLDNLLFYEVGNEHLNVYARYPIYSAFREDCKYHEEETGNYCKNGFIKNRMAMNVLIGGEPKRCPVCEKNHLIGPGSNFLIDPPNDANEGADLRNPVQITPIEVDSLEYNNTDIEAREMKIFQAVVGNHQMSINDKAVNEKQVAAIFESLETALQVPQENFEKIMTWSEETICKLRYGNSFVSASISLGTEHYILSPSQIMEMYIAAKQGDFSTSTLDILQDKWFATEYRNNPDQLQRQQIIANVDPFRHLDNKEVQDMFSSGSISFEDYMLKVNLSSLIMRFERENLPLNQFGTGVEFDKKIDKIQEVLRGYAAEMKPVTEPATIE